MMVSKLDRYGKIFLQLDDKLNLPSIYVVWSSQAILVLTQSSRHNFYWNTESFTTHLSMSLQVIYILSKRP